MVCQHFKVLHGSGEVELVACTGESAQAHSLEAMMGLQMSKAHSIFLRSSRDLSNSGVPISVRA